MITSKRFDANYIQWFDGMPLSCHHFQQSDIRNHDVTRYLLTNIAPYSWGVVTVKIDLPSINSSIIQIIEFECIMPDYSVIFFPMYNEGALEINVGHHKNDDKEILLYCVMTDDHNVYESDLMKNRYQSVQGDAVVDMNTGDNREKVIRLSPVMHLTTQKPPINLLSIPIVKFTFRSGSLKIVQYDPPAPNLNCTTHTKACLNSTIAKLYSKLQEAYTKLKIQNKTADFKNYGYLIVREIWPLQVLVDSDAPNIFQVYQSLVRACSMLATIVDDSMPPLNAKYNHLDILDSFSCLLDFIDQKITSINQLYALGLNKFDSEQDKGRFTIIITARESMEIKIMLQFAKDLNFTQWIQNAIISSNNTFEAIKLSRTLGCRREILDSSRVVDNTRSVTVSVYLDKSSIRSNFLYISNNIGQQSPPMAIYLLDD